MTVEEFDELFSDVHRKVIVTFNSVEDINTDEVLEDTTAKKVKQWTRERQIEFVTDSDDTTLRNIIELLREEGSSVDIINDQIINVLISNAKQTLGY